MSLRDKIADAFVKEPFYLVETKNSNGDSSNIQKISIKESAGYWIKTGKLPTNPGLTLIFSGGSVKTLYNLGFYKKLQESGISIGHYFLSSGSSPLVLSKLIEDFDEFEKFALDIPDLIEPLERQLVFQKLKKIDTLTEGIFRKSKLDTGNTKIKVNRGLVSTDKLEEKLKNYCKDKTIGEMENVTIMATDYSARKPVSLGIDYPNMPLYKAILASISLPKIFKPVEYDGRLFGDAGPLYHFPLKPNLLNNNKTIIAIKLGHNNEEYSIPIFYGYKGILFDGQYLLDDVTSSEVAELRLHELCGTTAVDLSENGDKKNFRVYLDLPTIDIPPNTIELKMDKRKELVDMGYEAAEKALYTKFRQPISFFNLNNKKT